jgi:spermidine synthase
VFPHVHSYSSYIPSFATEWGFLLTSGQAIDSRPDPDTVDKLLAEKTTGGFKMFDGITLLGMLQIPAHIRRAIAAETEVYTLAKPPKLFGTG